MAGMQNGTYVMWGVAAGRAWECSYRQLATNAPGLFMSLLLLTVGCSSAQGHLWGRLFLGPGAAVPESARGGCNRGRLCTGEGCDASTPALVQALRSVSRSRRCLHLLGLQQHAL